MQDFPPPLAYHALINTPLSCLAALIKLPPAPLEDIAYKDLAFSDQDKACIGEIIQTVAENGKLTLLSKQNHLRFLGAQVNHVHPLKFLATSIGTEETKNFIRVIFDDYFKRNGYMEGLAPSLTREADKNNLEKYLPEFAEEINVPLDSFRFYFQVRDWEGLVRFLIRL